MGASRDFQPILRTAAALVLLAALALCGNYFDLPIAFGVSFIFGSIFSLLAAARFGILPGLGIAVLSSSYTYVLWNHPYAIVILSLETLWVGAALRRGKTNLVLIDAAYWLLLGTPQILLYYGGVMALGMQHALVIVLKQSMNGIFNALVAWILLSLLSVALGPEKTGLRNRLSYHQVIFQVAAFFLMVPSLGILLLQAHRDVVSQEQRLAQEILLEAQQSTNTVSQWVSVHINAARIIGELGTTYPLVPSGRLQEEVARIHALFPAFHNVFLGDATATTIAFDPPVNKRGESTIGINFADRAWFKTLSGSLQPTISDVFMGRGGIFVPICSISVPIVREGKLLCFGLGAIDLTQLQNVLAKGASREGMTSTIIDRNGNVIFSTDESRPPLSRVENIGAGQVLASSDGVQLVVPGHTKNISIMETWKGAYYLVNLPVAGTPWKMLVEYPVAPLQKYLYASAIWGLSVVALFFGVMIVLAAITSRLLALPILSLARVTENLPARIGKGEHVHWPRSFFDELTELISHFQQASASLDLSFSQLNAANVRLEESVRERTAELATERQRLAYILEGTNVGTWEWNVQTGETVFNERWAGIIGYTLAELAPISIETWTKFAHPDDLARSGELLQKHFRKELPYYECEARMRHKNGDWVWVFDRGKVATWTEDGNPLMMSGTHQEITDRKLAEEEIRHLATHDLLTDLPSLRLASDRLAMALHLARRHNTIVAVFFVDLDGFKAVNDTMGHDAGDFVLKAVAQRLLSCARSTDTVARIGGDEFLLVGTELHSAEDAARIAEKMLQAVAQPVLFKGQQAVVGASIGIALFPEHSDNMDHLIKLADKAMYQIKNSGKNNFAFATPE